MGLLITVVLHSAAVQDYDGAAQVLKKAADSARCGRLRLIWADGIYNKESVYQAGRRYGWEIEIVKRSDDVKGFKLLPRRWVVERTFSWLGRNRRLARDYERLPETGECFIYMAMCRLMLKRLTKSQLS